MILNEERFKIAINDFWHSTDPTQFQGNLDFAELIMGYDVGSSQKKQKGYIDDFIIFIEETSYIYFFHFTIAKNGKIRRFHPTTYKELEKKNNLSDFLDLESYDYLFEDEIINLLNKNNEGYEFDVEKTISQLENKEDISIEVNIDNYNVLLTHTKYIDADNHYYIKITKDIKSIIITWDEKIVLKTETEIKPFTVKNIEELTRYREYLPEAYGAVIKGGYEFVDITFYFDEYQYGEADLNAYGGIETMDAAQYWEIGYLENNVYSVIPGWALFGRIEIIDEQLHWVPKYNRAPEYEENDEALDSYKVANVEQLFDRKKRFIMEDKNKIEKFLDELGIIYSDLIEY